MRILILGAGATGGYFGGHLAKAGADVTFLVRQKRAEILKTAPLKIESPLGNIEVSVNTTTAGSVTADYDAIILSCKAYDLENAIAAIHPAVKDHTLILPLLNGMAHLDTLDQAFGSLRVLGGSCHISTTLRPDGTIQHMNDFARLTFGARNDAQVPSCNTLAKELHRGGFEIQNSADIIAAMWEKWVMLATLAAMTTLFRAHTGEIARTQKGAEFTAATLAECCAIAAANGNTISDTRAEEMRTFLTNPAINISASMRRDLEAGQPIEANHIIADLIARGEAKNLISPMLQIAYTGLEAYQNRLKTRV